MDVTIQEKQKMKKKSLYYPVGLPNILELSCGSHESKVPFAKKPLLTEKYSGDPLANPGCVVWALSTA